MTKLWSWIKTHKIITLLLLIILFLIFKDQRRFIPLFQNRDFQQSKIGMSTEQSLPIAGRGGVSDLSIYPETPPVTGITDRKVVSESYLSLLVNNVVETQKKIISTAQSLGGYMVSSDLQNPQDAPTATVIVRVPSTKLNTTLEKLHGFAVKVVSENLQGTDVTDEYVDNEARLATLEKTKTKFEQILDQAVKIEDILNVQREIINLQAQIDAIKGQQKYLEQTAKLAKITVYLSTDELALPYAPSEAWRPKVIFKQAVRSMVGCLRKFATAVIWFLVYSVIWVPILLIVLFVKKRRTS